MNTFGLIGRSLSHSFSQGFFNQLFAEKGIEAEYKLYEIPNVSLLRPLIAANSNLVGLNVTIPFKETIINELDEIDPEAAQIGAVNTIRITNGKLKGYNTDVHGFRDSIKPFLAHGMEHALILGTGGASRAVDYALRSLGIEVLLVSRSPSGENEVHYDDLNEQAMKAFRLIVNTTPLGTFPNLDDLPQLPYQYLTPDHLLYDLVYNPAETAFMKAGKARGAVVTNGLTMLHLQALKSWEIWNRA